MRTIALSLILCAAVIAQTRAPLPPLPAPMAVPKPGPAGDAPYAPQPILPGGVVIPLYPPGSPYLKAERVREAEQYNMSQAVPGRINSIVNIHNPSIEVHPVDRGLNTGAVVILVAGGGHNTLNVGSESADFVPFFYNYGVNTVILRNRLRRDGYNPQMDAVNDAQQAIRMVRAYAKEWGIDPNKIGIMGFSAGAELAAPAAVLFEDFDKKNNDPGDRSGGNLRAPRLRRHHLSGAIALRAQPYAAADPAQRPAGLRGLRRIGRPGSRRLGDRILQRNAGDERAEHRDAHLRQRPPSRRPAARRRPHDGRPDRPQRHALRHVAIPLHRLVP